MILLLDVYGVAYLGDDLNFPLLEGLQPLRKKGLRIAFASNMATGQKTLFWNGLGLSRYGDALYCSGDLGVAKPEAAFYQRATLLIDTPENNVLFVDDSAGNVLAARKQGWHAILYESAEAIIETAQAFIDSNLGK